LPASASYIYIGTTPLIQADKRDGTFLELAIRNERGLPAANA
jgi:hypothetical protein